MTRLRAARLAARTPTGQPFTVVQAARVAGITPGYLRTLERKGAMGLTWPRARRLARLYGVDPVGLLGRTNDDEGRSALRQ